MIWRNILGLSAERKNPRPLPSSVGLREVIQTTIRSRLGHCSYRDGALEAAMSAAEAVRPLGSKAMVDAIAAALKQYEIYPWGSVGVSAELDAA